MVNQVSWILGILDKSLNSIFGEELSIGLVDSPVQLCVELARGRRGEEVDLAVECVEDRVQTSGDVPFAFLPVPETGIKALHLSGERDLGVVVI